MRLQNATPMVDEDSAGDDLCSSINLAPALKRLLREEDEADIVRRLSRACTTSGFFRITVCEESPSREGLERVLSALSRGPVPLDRNGRVTSAGTERVVGYDDCRRWFAQPLEAKARYPLCNGKGYQYVGQNVTEGKPDAHEALDFYRPFEKSELGTLKGPHPDIGDDELLQRVDDTARAFLRLGKIIMRFVAMGLGLADDAFEDDIAGCSFWILRLISSPPMSSDDEGEYKVSCGAHTDYGLLSFLDASCGGLQIEDLNGQWVDVPHVPGTIVCNIGQMLQLCSGNRYRATKHRVIRHREETPKDRISIAFFYEPNYDAVIKPMLESIDLDPKSPTLIRYADFLRQKVATNFINAQD